MICPECGGEGLWHWADNPEDEVECERCHGTGEVEVEPEYRWAGRQES